MIAKKLAPDLRSGVRVSAKPGLRPVFGTLVLVFAATHARPEVIQIKMEHSGAGTAHVGDTVEWVNADFVAHTATLRGGAWDVLISVNATRSVVLKAAGQVDYYCKFHPNITGQTSVSK